MNRAKNTLRFAVLLFLVASGYASAWWNDAWPYRVPITIDNSTTGAAVSENADEFTVLVKLHSGNFQDFFLTKEDLSDIRFVANDDKTPLKHHLEKVDIINQLVYVWVKIPVVSGGISTEKIWMYYGNMEAVASADAAASYDVNTVLLYHFPEGDPARNFTAYEASTNITAEISPASIIGSGIRFDGTTGFQINDNPALQDPASGLSVSVWVRASGMQDDAYLFQRTDGSTSLTLAVDQNMLYARMENGIAVETPRVPAISPDNWHHVALTISDVSLTLYVDGNAIASSPLTTDAPLGNWTVGANADGTGNQFIGEIDELRIDAVARPAGWIKLLAANQGMADSLLTLQAAEQLGSGGSNNFFAVIFQSTEESGWTVIILLGIMAAISWLVMIGKTIYIQRVTRDNQDFLTQYRKIGSGDPAQLDHQDTEEDEVLENSPIIQAMFGDHDHFQSSPIYRIYHRGMQEVRDRVGVSAGARAAGLSSQSVSAIRAALDAQMIREAQRLNSKMVLLTIAISGGPFLGLLGTVLGVMITFAAIAATGDVNISAIAPGVAAALLTTVAGLVVAIPALFGYNWLATKIKENIADMRVFVDEYVTRIAEYYDQ